MDFTTNKKSLWSIELLSWLITLVVLALVFLPMYGTMQYHRFMWHNALYVVFSITFIRYLFMTKYIPYFGNIIIKTGILLFCIPLCFHLIEGLQQFKQYFDQEEGLLGFDQYFLASVEHNQRMSIFEYFRLEYMWFGVTAVVSCILVPFRMVKSIWRTYNKTGEV
jgi:hypothetical protein